MAGRKKDGTDELVLARCYAGGREGKPQKQVARKGACTQKQKAMFLEVLEQTSNVSAACREIGKSSSTMYALRERDRAFHDAWMTALEHGFAALEMEMLRRARFGQDVTEYRPKRAGRARRSSSACIVTTIAWACSYWRSIWIRSLNIVCRRGAMPLMGRWPLPRSRRGC
ncbi:hypothetical protein [Rhizorhapis sp. SPR117]|uniref:hypothetical protein n=1 Tax=Rhizorhapis sp. SPR117 TaxID=2912611 RepID=UPI001F20C92C|nr:hypothetical protein [Rhizorhapis sp. SPR117]